MDRTSYGSATISAAKIFINYLDWGARLTTI